MKNNIILKGMFLLAALCVVDFVNAKKELRRDGPAVQPTTGTQQETRGRVPQFSTTQLGKLATEVPSQPVVASQVPARTTSAQQPSAPPVTTTIAGQPEAIQPLSSQESETLKTWQYPLTPDRTLWLTANWKRLDNAQQKMMQDRLEQYNRVQAREAARLGIAPVIGTMPMEVEQEAPAVAARSGWSVSGALSGAKQRAEAAASWGWQKGKEAYGYVSSIPGAIWDYESAIGTGTKTIASTGVIAAAPYVAAAMGTTALGLPALAAGATSYGVLSLLDRLEQRYRTGTWTQSGAIGLERMKLEQDLSDTSAWPTPSTKLEALNSPDEIEGKTSAENKKARQIIEQQLNNMLKNDQVRNFDSAVKARVTDIRAQAQYSPKALEVKNTTKEKMTYLRNYIDILLRTYKEMDLYSAILSEYRRAEKQLQKLQAAEQIASQAAAQEQ